jgi:hypothetical protein
VVARTPFARRLRIWTRQRLWGGQRPALKRLLADIGAGKIDLVVCYKVVVCYNLPQGAAFQLAQGAGEGGAVDSFDCPTSSFFGRGER